MGTLKIDPSLKQGTVQTDSFKYVGQTKILESSKRLL